MWLNYHTMTDQEQPEKKDQLGLVFKESWNQQYLSHFQFTEAHLWCIYVTRPSSLAACSMLVAGWLMRVWDLPKLAPFAFVSCTSFVLRLSCNSIVVMEKSTLRSCYIVYNGIWIMLYRMIVYAHTGASMEQREMVNHISITCHIDTWQIVCDNCSLFTERQEGAR